MCLAVKYKAECSLRRGYKLLYKKKGGYYTGMCGYPEVHILKSRYVRDPKFDNGILGGEYLENFLYPSGFHICVSLRQARYLKAVQQQRYRANPNLVICEVAFREQVAYGIVKWHYIGVKTFSCKTVVAKECRIVREV